MSEPFQLMMTGFSSGAGLALLGGANAFWRRASLAVRGPVSLAIIGMMSGIAFAATGEMEPARRVALLLTITYAALLLAGSNWLASAIGSIASAVRTPVVRWGAPGLIGFAASLGSIAYTEFEQGEALDREMAELEALTGKPPCETPAIRVLTDSGREVAVQEATALRDAAEIHVLDETMLSRTQFRDNVIRCQPASDRTNCHGWVFTGGRYWVAGTEVARILNDNGYRTADEPRPGDLVIYRGGDDVLHTALVRYVSERQPVLVEGKWGCSGVYLHPVDKSIYGANFKYYRSSRSGHILAGLNSVDPQQHAQGSPHIIPNPANPDEFTE